MTTRYYGRSPRRAAAGAAILLCAIAIPVLTGCHSESTMSDKEISNFKGGPMPAGFMEKHGSKPVSAPPSPAQEKK